MLGEVRDGDVYVTGLGVSPTARCSLLAGPRINCQSSDYWVPWTHLQARKIQLQGVGYMRVTATACQISSDEPPFTARIQILNFQWQLVMSHQKEFSLQFRQPTLVDGEIWSTCTFKGMTG